MNNLRYFAYGSNLHPRWLRSRTPSAEILSKERLPNFSLKFNKHGLDDSGKCNIVSSNVDSDVVYGVVYAFSSLEKKVLDVAERGYEQEFIKIGNYDKVLVYIAKDTVEGYSSPHSWYQDIVIAGAEYHRFPKEYIGHIRSFSAIDDPDPARELKFRNIVWPP
jgi:gamma-glutamylcyclotransferase